MQPFEAPRSFRAAARAAEALERAFVPSPVDPNLAGPRDSEGGSARWDERTSTPWTLPCSPRTPVRMRESDR